MELKNKITTIALASTLGFAGAANGQTTVLNETFDDDSGFTASSGLFSDGSSDYLGLTGGTDDFGAGSSPSGIPSFTGTTGSYLVGEDLDGEGATLPVTVTWSGLDITGLTDLSFSGDFGASTGGIDLTDDLFLAYQIDGGGYNTIIDFEFVTDGDDFNNIFTLTGGTSPEDDLGLALKSFTSAIAGTGSTLDLQLQIDLGSGGEEFAVDNFSVTAVPEPSAYALLAGLLGLGYVMVRRRQA